MKELIIKGNEVASKLTEIIDLYHQYKLNGYYLPNIKSLLEYKK